MDNKAKAEIAKKVVLEISPETAVWTQNLVARAQVQGGPEGVRAWLVSYDEMLAALEKAIAQLDAPTETTAAAEAVPTKEKTA